MRYTLILFFAVILAHTTKAQAIQEDTTVRIISVAVSAGIDTPGGDLKQRFGISNTVGGSVIYKTMSNWVFMAEGDYLFGRDVKITDRLLENIATEEGYIIDEGGIFTDIAVLQAGLTANISAGKLFPVFGPNKNSGIVVMAGAGYMFHKIRIEQNENSAPQISGEYGKGYDRLTEGINTSQFIGYQYYGNNNITNFYVGIELHQGWTSPSRPYNFDEMRRPGGNRFDALYGLKVGWIVPLGKQTGRKVFVY
jgi:hypothetical protein